MKKTLLIIAMIVSVLNGKNINIVIGKTVVVPTPTYMCKTDKELSRLIKTISTEGLNILDPLFVKSRCRLLHAGTTVKILDGTWSMIKISEPRFGSAYITRETLEN